MTKIKIQLSKDEFKKKLDIKDGKDGEVGRQGIQGIKGIQGTAGTQGTTGDTGDIGEAGEIGESGIDGKDFKQDRKLSKQLKKLAESQTGLISRFDGLGGSIARNFYQLFDTPDSYEGNSGKILGVKSTEDGLEFVTDTSLTNEQVEDVVGAMFSGNTETLITATYQDADGTIDLVVDEASIDHGSIAGLGDDDHPQYAKTALDNLASVAINESLISDTNSTDDLGSSTIAWANAYIDKVHFNSTANISGEAAGALLTTGRIAPDVDNVDDLGAPSLAYKTIYARAIQQRDGLVGITFNGDVNPDVDSSNDLGRPELRWDKLYLENLRTGDTAADTLLLQARDVDGSSWTTFATLTANDTPTMSLDGAVTGTTQSASDNSTKLATTAYADAAVLPMATDVIWDAKGDLAGGTGVDTAVKLAIGTNDFVLTAASGETTGMKWAAAAGGAMATDAIWDVKGDLAVGTGADTAIRLAAGADGKVLTAASGQTSGLAWSDAAAGGQTLYGAIVDAAGGGDYTLLSAALTAGETSIFIRNGTYVETADINLTVADIQITGESKEKTIIDFDSNTQLDINGRNNCVVRNLTFKGGNGNGVIFLKSGRTMILDCLFESNSTDIKISGGQYNLISRCEFKSATGVNLVSSSIHNRIIDCEFNKSRILITATCDFTQIIGCNYASTTDLTMTADKCLVMGNIFGSNQITTRGGVAITGNNNVVSGNIFVRGQTAINAVVVSGNNNIISDNNIEGATVAYDDNISLSSTANNNIISNNYIAGAAAYGINIESSNETNNLITGNQFLGNTTAPINDLGTGTTIRDNIGTDIIQDEKRFIQAKNTSGGELVQGDIVILKAVAAGNEVTTTTTQGDNSVFAICDATIVDNATGRVQILGKTTALKVDGTTDIAIGDYIGTFTTAKIGVKAVAGDMAIAIALEAYSTDDSNGVIDALLITPRKITIPPTYGEINRVSNTTETTITTQNAYVQITIFDTDGENNNSTPDHTNDHITIVKAGRYLITCSVTLDSVGGAGSTAEMEVQKNNGNVRVGSLHVDRTLSGGGAESSAETMTGIANLSVNDTIEVWIKNETNTQNYVVEDITLSLVQIGG